MTGKRVLVCDRKHHDLHEIMRTSLDIEIVKSSRGESWSLRGNRFKQRSDLLPAHLRRAFSSASANDFERYLTKIVGNRTWSIDQLCYGVSFSRDLFYELSIQHGYLVLSEVFQDTPTAPVEGG